MATTAEHGLHKPLSASPDWWDILEDDRGNPPSRGLFIGNVPHGTRGSTIRAIFAPYGKIETSSPAGFGQVDRGFALLTYQDIASAKRALSHLYLQDLFNQGEGCKIRFSDLQRRSKPLASEISSSKLNESHSEWFQQSSNATPAPVAVPKVENGEVPLTRANLSPTKLAPTAPKKMLEHAKKAMTFPSAPRTMRVDVSPPPLRRVDTYRPEHAPHREENRHSSYHDQRPSREALYGDRDIDRYIPSYSASDEEYGPRRDDKTYPAPRYRGRSPRRSPSYSQAPRKSEARSSSPGDRGGMSFQASIHDRPSTVAQAGDLRGQPEKSVKDGSMQSATIGANITLSLLKNPAAAKRSQEEGTSSNSARPTEIAEPLHSLQVSAQKDSPGPVVAPPETEALMGNLPSWPSTTKAREDQAALRSISAALHRLRPPTDDTSSVTSSSTKSSQRKKQCAHCKAPDGFLQGTLVKCGTCSRRYHASCGKPTPASTKEHEVFTCGRCLRKSRTSMVEQTRAASPKLGTPNYDSLMPDALVDDPIKSPEIIDVANQPSHSDVDMPAIQQSTSRLEESKAGSGTHLDNSPRSSGSAISGAPTDDCTKVPRTDPPELAETTQIRQEATNSSQADPHSDPTHAGRDSMIMMQRAVSTFTYRRPYVTSEAEERDRSIVGGVLPAIFVTSSKAAELRPTNSNGPADQPLQQETTDGTASADTPRPDIIRSPPTESRLKKSGAIPVAPTSIQDQVMEMTRRYKNVTCPDWMSSGCKYTSRSCNFAHQDTGIDLPGYGPSPYNPHWTCYKWMHTPRCPLGDRCSFAHTDTGLYVGSNGRYSTKHLTCSFWQTGGCKYTAEQCLFAHQETGYSAAGRVARDVAYRAQMGYGRRTSEAGSRGFLPSWHPVGQSRDRAEALSPQQTPPVATMVPAVNGRLFALDISAGDDAGPAFVKGPNIERDANQPHSPSQGRRLSLVRDSVDNVSTAEGSPYSPRSTIEDSKTIHGVNTSFLPASSIARGKQELIYGVDTPYSPTFTTATTEQSSPKRDTDGSSSRAAPVSRSLQREADSRLSTPFSPISAFTPQDPASPLSSVTGTPVSLRLARGQKEGSTAAANSAIESEQGQKSKPLSIGNSSSKPQGTDASSHSRVQDVDRGSAAKSVQAGSTPSKHYAKRSTVDPRTLRRNMLASAAAKSASPVEGSVTSITSIKKCEKCDKRIFGSASHCASCSKESTSVRASPGRSSEQVKVVDPGDIEQSRLSSESTEKSPQILVDFMAANAGQSVLAVAKEHKVSSVSDPMSAKSLKRPHEDAVFIQRKRPKVMVPRTKPTTKIREGQGNETAQIRYVSIVDSKLKVSEPQSMEQATGDRLEQKATEHSPSVTSGDIRDQHQNVEAHDQLDNNKENRRPSFSSLSQAREEKDANFSEDNDSSEAIPTIPQSQNKLPPQGDLSVSRDQPETRAEEEDEEGMEGHEADADNDAPEKRIILKFKVKKTRKTTTATRCATCMRNHKTCLHDGSDHFDPARCAEYLEKVRIGARKKDAYWNRHLPAITAAAHRYTNGKDKEDSSADDQSDDEDVVYQNAVESIVPASPSSSEDPLGHIDTSMTQGRRPRPGKLDGAHSEHSSADKGKGKPLEVHAAIPTPAHTPSPAVAGPDILSTQQTPSKAVTKDVSKSPKPDLKKVLGMLRKRGVQFDSNDDSDEDMEDTRASTTDRPQSCWPPKASSHNLFEVAPALRPPSEPAITIQNPAPTIPSLRAGLSKKELWKTLPQIQCAERRARYGNPHKIVDRNLPSCIVRTTIQEEAPLTEQQRLAFHVPAVETKEVRMPFERFLRMPEEPVVVRENKFRNREGRVVEFDLAFRDGRRERERGVTAGGRKSRDWGVRWPFARG